MPLVRVNQFAKAVKAYMELLTSLAARLASMHARLDNMAILTILPVTLVLQAASLALQEDLFLAITAHQQMLQEP